MGATFTIAPLSSPRDRHVETVEPRSTDYATMVNVAPIITMMIRHLVYPARIGG